METIKNIRDEKAEMIIAVAQERFGLFGIEKTTMQEIASDLRISKGLLYYYFPDKEHLYKAVVEKEQEEFLKVLRSDIDATESPEECLRKYVLTRISYFRSLLNLGRLRSESFHDLMPLIAESMVNFRQTEKDLITRIIRDGVRKKVFRVSDVNETVSLFLDLLRGLRLTLLREKKIMTINESEYSELSGKALAFAEIFIRSLKYTDK